MIRIVVDGKGSRAVELCIRAALGERSEGERWLVTAVRLPARWVVSFLDSPEDRMGGHTWVGPAHQMRRAVEEALCAAGVLSAPPPTQPRAWLAFR